MVASISRIWTLWWSTRPGRNSMRRTRLITGSASAVTPSASGTRRRTMAVVSAISGSMRSRGQTMAAMSAAAMPANGRTIAISSAIGASTSRDQCISDPNGALSRCWTMSCQPWPLSRSVAVTIRIASSLSPRRGTVPNCSSVRAARSPATRAHAPMTSFQLMRSRFGHAARRIAQLAPRQALYALLAGPALETDIKISLCPLRQPRQISTRSSASSARRASRRGCGFWRCSPRASTRSRISPKSSARASRASRGT